MSRRVTEKLRKYRSAKWEGIGKFLAGIGLSANILTTLSLISGLTAVYYLFNHYSYFLLFSVLHLILDSLDGVVARVTKETTFGQYYDLITDNIIAILLFIKVGSFLNDYYPWLIIGVFVIALIIHIYSRCKAPIFFMRSPAIIAIAIFTIPGISYTNGLLTFGYLVGGVFVFFSLARQIQWFLGKSR